MKLGGSLITPKREGALEVKEDVIRQVTLDLLEIYRSGRRLFLAHGAGPFGHIPVRRYGIHEGLRPGAELGVSETMVSMMDLNLRVARVMMELGLPVIPFHPRLIFRREGDELTCGLETALRWIRSGFVPLTHGDLVHDNRRVVSVLSADEIPLCLLSMGLREVLFLTDVPGVLNEMGEVLREVSGMNLPDLGGSSFDVTGSMRGKLDVALRLARMGIDVRIAGFSERGDLIRALKGESGTRIRP